MAEVGGSAGSGFNPAGYAQLGEYLANLVKHPTQIFITNPFQGLEDLFEGKPRSAATIAAVLRLGESDNPVIKQLGRNLATLEQGGVVLSTSGGVGRENLNKIYSRAVSGLVAQGTPTKIANSVLDLILAGVPGQDFNKIFAPVGSIPPTGPIAPGFGGGQGDMRVAPPFPAPPLAPSPQPGGFSFPGAVDNVTGFLSQVGKALVPGVSEFEDITGIQIPTLPTLNSIASQIGTNIGTKLSNAFSGQPSRNADDSTAAECGFKRFPASRLLERPDPSVCVDLGHGYQSARLPDV